jgi:hypothetical protein
MMTGKCLTEGVDRTGTDVTKYNANRARTQRQQRAFGGMAIVMILVAVTKIVCLRSNHLVSPASTPTATLKVDGPRALACHLTLHNKAILNQLFWKK